MTWCKTSTAQKLRTGCTISFARHFYQVCDSKGQPFLNLLGDKVLDNVLAFALAQPMVRGDFDDLPENGKKMCF